MRLRNKQWTYSFLEKNKWYLIETKNKINPDIIFNNNNKVYLEIGCGKGQFIIEKSNQNKDKNYIAMEKETTVIGVALKKAIQNKEKDFSNLRFLNKFAENLLDIFEVNSFDGIYLNFSDPWPKARYYKKRLTYIRFLEIYFKLLKDNGIIEIKTDNDNLYEFSLEQIKESKFKLLDNTNDLYKNNKMLEGNIATEYETKFHNIGKNINKIILKKQTS